MNRCWACRSDSSDCTETEDEHEGGEGRERDADLYRGDDCEGVYVGDVGLKADVQSIGRREGGGKRGTDLYWGDVGDKDDE